MYSYFSYKYTPREKFSQSIRHRKLGLRDMAQINNNIQVSINRIIFSKTKFYYIERIQNTPKIHPKQGDKNEMRRFNKIK